MTVLRSKRAATGSVRQAPLHGVRSAGVGAAGNDAEIALNPS
jgi:hypothetical protein